MGGLAFSRILKRLSLNRLAALRRCAATSASIRANSSILTSRSSAGSTASAIASLAIAEGKATAADLAEATPRYQGARRPSQRTHRGRDVLVGAALGQIAKWKQPS